MDAEGLRKRPAADKRTTSGSKHSPKSSAGDLSGRHNGGMQLLRMAALVVYFLLSCVCLHFQQFLGFPLYFYNRDWYYAWQALTKQYFGLLLVTMQQWWLPIEVHITGDKTVTGQIERTKHGRVRLKFPERTVQISNHQLYTDWVYLWWSSYAASRHGHLFIILKASLRWIPIIGPGMMIFSFIFLSRHWDTDKPRFQHRLRKLKTKHSGPMSGSQELDPMWLLIFPEGTTLCANGRIASAKWAEKNGIPDMEHTLLPRSRGLQLCLEELQGTMDWVYDCTLSYSGIPPGEYGQDVFTLKEIYLEGKGPSAIHMHWRRFNMNTIPVNDDKEFDLWLRERWAEKDQLLEYFARNGAFPADRAAIVAPLAEANGDVKAASKEDGTVITEVSPYHPLEFIQIFVSVLAVPLVWRAVKWIFWFLSFFVRLPGSGR